MSLLIIRTILLYFLILLSLKLMGKRQVGQLQPSELVVVLVISEMASLSMQSDSAPLLNSVVPILVISTLQIILSLLDLKSEKFRSLICGHPTIIIKNGIIQEDAMRKLRMTINDLQEQLRCQGYFSIHDIQYAIMETNGNLSAMPTTPKRTVCPEDLQLDLAEEMPEDIFILDGHVNNKALLHLGKNQKWLRQILQSNQINDPSQIFIAGLDSQGKFFYQFKVSASKNSQKKV